MYPRLEIKNYLRSQIFIIFIFNLYLPHTRDEINQLKIMKKSIITVVAILFCSIPSQSFAWGMTGHRVVGEIAQYYLTAKAKLAIKKIMGHEDLAMAANWGDFIKSDTSYKHLDVWHYVNLPVGLDKAGVFSYLNAEKMPNVYNKSYELIATLKNPKSTLSQKKFAIRMLVHLIGDMNQPMHTGRKDDLGGNRVSVTWFGQKSNLHRVWDSDLIESQQLSYTEYAKAINNPSPIQLINWRKERLNDVIYDSYLAANRIYANTKPDDKLSYRYNYDFVDLLNSQLLKGGVRLANILNEIYK